MTSVSLNGPLTGGFVSRLRHASPLLWTMSLIFLAAFVVCAILPLVDGRQFNGISNWIKPAKFFLSVAAQMLTLAWGISLMPQAAQRARAVTWPAAYFALAAVFELGYICYRAALGEASHFNDSSPSAAILYNLMGVAAVGMMLATGWLGWRILRTVPRNAVAVAAGWGSILAMAGTIVVGLTLGGMQSHWIGGDQTDATGLPIFGWSTTGGDLRISHFLALHLSQALPLAAWLGGVRFALVAGVFGLAALTFTYVQALMGIPLLGH